MTAAAEHRGAWIATPAVLLPYLAQRDRPSRRHVPQRLPPLRGTPHRPLHRRERRSGPWRTEVAMKPFFEPVVQQEMTVGGLKLRVPVFYQDMTSMNAVFTASTQRVTELLSHPDLRPVEFRRGRSLLSVTALEYLQSGIGPYNEVAIAAPVVF